MVLPTPGFVPLPAWVNPPRAIVERSSERDACLSRAQKVPKPQNYLGTPVKTVIWPRVRVIHRIHLSLYGGSAFNPSVKGNALFSPIKNAPCASIPMYYGGTTFDCAAMEPVFHDVPFAARLKTFYKAKLAEQVYSTMTC
ncbi:hypothetical protein [Mesorhizobium sp. 43Arga]